MVLALASCSARGAQTSACTPGSTEACACADGRSGVRFCQSDQSLTACVCSGDGDTPVDAVQPDVAQPDVAQPDVVSLDVAVPDVPSTVDVVDAPPASDVAVVDAVTDSGASDAPPTYPPGPYGSRTCSRFAPFRLSTCDDALWDFAGPDFFTSTATLVLVGAVWSSPSQLQASQVEAQLSSYRSLGVRVVQVLVEGADSAPITASACNAWRSRYALTVPVLMDPSRTLSAYYPSGAFPAAIVVDRHGQIRSRLYGADSGLSMVRAVLDDVLDRLDTCTP